MSTLTYIRSDVWPWSSRVHALVDGKPLHSGYPSKDPYTWEPPEHFEPGEGLQHTDFCRECKEREPRMLALHHKLRTYLPPGVEGYLRQQDCRPGNYMDFYGGLWMVPTKGAFCKPGKHTRRDLKEHAPFIRLGDLPDLTDPKTNWTNGKGVQVPVTYMSLAYITNVIGLCQRMGVTPECAQALRDRQTVLLRKETV